MVDPIAGSFGQWTTHHDTCVIWAHSLDHNEVGWLYDHMLARNYAVLATTEDRATLFRLMPFASAVVLWDVCGLADDLGDCVAFADCLRAYSVELIHARPKAEPTAYSIQHDRVLALVRALAKIAHIADTPAASLEEFWRLIGRL